MCRDNLLKHLDTDKEFGISGAMFYQAGAGLDDRAQFHKTLPDGRSVTFTAPALIFPVSNSAYVREQLYYAGEGNRREQTGPTMIFNSTAFNSRDKPIFVTRREVDCLAIAQEHSAALAIGTTDKGLRLFASLIGMVKPAHPLILALGMDPDGKLASAKLEKALDEAHVPYITAGYRLTGKQDSASALARMDRPALSEAVKKLTGYALNPDIVSRETEQRALDRQKAADEAQTALDEKTEKEKRSNVNWATDAAQARFETILGTYYADGTNLDVVLASNDSTSVSLYLTCAVPKLRNTERCAFLPSIFFNSEATWIPLPTTTTSISLEGRSRKRSRT